MSGILRLALTLALFGSFVPFGGGVFAQNQNAASTGSSSDIVDCTDISIGDSHNNPTLTKEERLAAMNEAFYASLGKFDYCAAARQQSSSGGAAGSAAGSAGTDRKLTGTMSHEDTTANASSRASTDLSGTLPPKTEAPAGTLETIDQALAKPADSTSPPTKAISNNGTAPKDIPPADNDDAVAAQIRKAATEETDPKVKKQLWTEYRKYKGIPTSK